MSYAVLDLETTVKTSYKRKANPFDKDNWVVLAGVKLKGGGPQSLRFNNREDSHGFAILPTLLNPALKILVGANIKFDLLHLLQNERNLAAYMEWVAQGGMIWDVQLAEYLLEGMTQQSHWLKLDEIAPRYGGNIKFDEVKALWDAGVDTPDIDPDLLQRYLCGGEDENGDWQEGDLGNTEKAFLGQVLRARASNQMNSIMLNMDGLLGTIEMERNGMFVSREIAEPLAVALKAAIEELTVSLKQYLPADLPFEFSWTSPRHKSAFIFGGVVNYDSREYVHADGTTTLCSDWDIEKHFGDAPPLVYTQKEVVCAINIDGSLCPIDSLSELQEYQRFKAGKNAGELKTKRIKCDDLSKPKARKCKAPWKFDGITEPDKQWETAVPGVYQVSAAVIEELGSRDIPFLKVMAKLATLTKDLGTYYISEELDEEGIPIPGKSKGMLTLVDPLGIIHHGINHPATVTGRLSSSNPNLQNIPKGNKSDVKQVFISRFKDGKIIQSDFSSLEVYIQAILTNCQQLIADLKAGLDMHCVRLAAKEKMEYAEVVKLAKGYYLPDGTKVQPVSEWDYKRTGSKVFSFQRAYGAGVKKIADSTGMTTEEVEALIAAEMERYPEIEPYYENLTATISANRRPYRTVPHPFVKGVMCNLGISRIQTPDGKVYTFVEDPAPEYLVKKRIYQSFSPTQIKNYTSQGEGGEWAKAALGLAVRMFYRKRNWGGLALLVNQVHDAVYADACATVARDAAACLHAAMECASDYMEWKFKWPIPVAVPSDTSMGSSMADDQKIEGLAAAAAEFRAEIRRVYMNGYVPSFAKE